MVPGPSPIEPEGVFDGLSWRAVLVGVLVDTVLTVIVSIPILLLFAGPELFSENEATSRAAEARAYESDLVNVISLIAGLGCTLLGGLVAARRSGRNFVRHGGWVGVVSLILGVALLAFLPQEPRQPAWVDVLGLLLVVPAGMLGGGVVARLRGIAA